MNTFLLLSLLSWTTAATDQLLSSQVADTPLHLHILNISSEPTALATAARAAAETHGAFYIDGHGIEPQLVQDALEALEQFYALPVAVKLGLALEPGFPSLLRGYVPMGRERVYALVDESNQASDPVEKFSISSGPAFNITAGENLWPHEVPQLQLALERLYDSTRRVAFGVFGILEDALQLEPGFFAAWLTGRSACPMRCLHYPPAAAAPRTQLRMAPHTDKGPFTLLPSDESESLEYLTGGVWRRVAHRPGTFLVHFGDAMRFWTSGRWESNWHRVGRPFGSTKSRIALAHFFNVDDNMPMIPFEAYARQSKGAQDASEPMLYGAWLQEQFASPGYYCSGASCKKDEL